MSKICPEIDIQTVVFGYFKLRYVLVPFLFSTHPTSPSRHGQILDTIDLENPPYKRDTVGFWLDVPRSTLELMREKGINPAEAIHAASHALMNRFDLGHELRTECKVPEKEYGKNAKESRRKRPAR
jgi:DEAD/DEAH box helicase domain-containing protein